MMHQGQGPSFFKIILPLSQISEKLQIPPQFVEHMDKEAFERATLRGPSGCCWPVKLHKDTNGMFLIDGWHSFFEAHSLKDYEVLVFKYERKMCFDVKIYGIDGLEKGNVPENGDLQSLQLDSGDEIESESESEEGRPRKESLSDKRNETQSVREKTSNAKRKPGRPRKHPRIDGPGLVTKGGDECYRENGKFCSAFPFFEQHMERINLKRHDLYVPTGFSRRYLCNGEMKAKMILRNEKGNSWEVSVIPHRGASYLSWGWACFSKENKLKVGDRCIFELVKKTEMQVHIFRSSEIENWRVAISKGGEF